MSFPAYPIKRSLTSDKLYNVRLLLVLLFLVQVCFEIIDPLAIQKIVDNKATYYAKIDVLPEWTRPELTENVPAISIWIDGSHALRKYEFQCSAADRYSPLSGFEIVDVRLVGDFHYRIRSQKNPLLYGTCSAKAGAASRPEAGFGRIRLLIDMTCYSLLYSGEAKC